MKQKNRFGLHFSKNLKNFFVIFKNITIENVKFSQDLKPSRASDQIDHQYRVHSRTEAFSFSNIR